MTGLSFGDSYGSHTPERRGGSSPLSFGGGVGQAFDAIWNFGSSGIPLSMGMPVSGFDTTRQRGGSGYGGNDGKNAPQAPAAPHSLNTANLDGSAGFQTALSGMGANLLESIGGSRDAPAPYTPVMFGSSSGGGEDQAPWMLYAAMAVGAVGLYYLVKS